jgi:ferritin-like metal-binding protein YciE
MAAYGSLRNFAELLGQQDITQILQKTLDEEKQADALLTQIGENTVNKAAAQGSAAAATSA